MNHVVARLGQTVAARNEVFTAREDRRFRRVIAWRI